jgi:hypothetical protein
LSVFLHFLLPRIHFRGILHLWTQGKLLSVASFSILGILCWTHDYPVSLQKAEISLFLNSHIICLGFRNFLRIRILKVFQSNG